MWLVCKDGLETDRFPFGEVVRISTETGMVNNINKKNYISINAEMPRRAYKVTKLMNPWVLAAF